MKKRDYAEVYLKAAQIVHDENEFSCCAVSKAALGEEKYKRLGRGSEDREWWRCPERTLYSEIFGFNQYNVADITWNERVLFLCMAAACWRDFK